jgi:signal transduction histidine kinase
MMMSGDVNDSNEEDRLSFWDQLIRPRPYILVSLIIIGIVLEICIYYFQNISAAFTQFFYLVIVLAGLWYQKKSIWIAVFFSALYLSGEFFSSPALSLDSVFRALMLCLVAIVIGSISERLIILQNRLRRQNLLLRESHEALEAGNKKLNLLSSITRHDIRNQLMALDAYISLSGEVPDIPDVLRVYFAKEQKIANTITHQINFTKDYEGLGVAAPVWQNISTLIHSTATSLPLGDVRLEIRCSGIEVFADPLLEKVFYNLIENALRYGGNAMTAIRIRADEPEEYLLIIVEDDGNGISADDKKDLFRKGFGKHTGLGLFLSREILSITGISIRETGIPGKGARFEICVPRGKYRLRNGTQEGSPVPGTECKTFGNGAV